MLTFYPCGCARSLVYYYGVPVQSPGTGGLSQAMLIPIFEVRMFLFINSNVCGCQESVDYEQAVTQKQPGMSMATCTTQQL